MMKVASVTLMQGDIGLIAGQLSHGALLCIAENEWRKKKLWLCSKNWRERPERRRGDSWRRSKRCWRKREKW